jgi:hypothetical protein
MDSNMFLTFATGALLLLNGLLSRGKEIDPNELTAGASVAEEAEQSPESARAPRANSATRAESTRTV